MDTNNFNSSPLVDGTFGVAVTGLPPRRT
jgi:hypothetical protein